MRIIAIIIAAVVALTVLGFGITVIDGEFGLWYQKHFGVRGEDVRRDIYTHSQSYIQGSLTRLSFLCGQLANADDGHASMINSQINTELVGLDANDVHDRNMRACLIAARAQG